MFLAGRERGGRRGRGGRKQRDNSLKAVSVVGRLQKTSGQHSEIKTGIPPYHVLRATVL